MDIVCKHWVKEECPESAAAASNDERVAIEAGRGEGGVKRGKSSGADAKPSRSNMPHSPTSNLARK
jgi:hypothetical protein